MTPDTAAVGGKTSSLRAVSTLVIAACLLAGAALRLIFPSDIEYKEDESWLFEHARALVEGAPWPWSGMTLSNSTLQPGLSVWLMGALAYLRGVTTPPQLASAVQTANVMALALFCLFILSGVPRQRREIWLWAAALWAVDPIAIILERKIWLPSMLPLPAVVFYAAWWWRRIPAAAFAWGALGVVLPQIHLGAALLAGAIAVWTLGCDRAEFPWKPWLAGSIVGALPALPWLIDMLGNAGDLPARWRGPNPTYFLRWATQPFGFGLQYSLGPTDFRAFLETPQIAGIPIWLIGALHLVLGALMLLAFVRAAAGLRKTVPPRRLLYSVFLGRDRETVLIGAALWGYGTLLTLLTIGRLNANRHYLVIVMPIMALWCARLVFAGDAKSAYRQARIILATLCLVQLALSASVLLYIRDRQVIHGEFGATWRAQQN
jgi:hypothetical protein